MDFRKTFGLSFVENAVCFGALALLALLPFVEFILKQFNLTIPGVNDIQKYMFLVTIFFAAMYAAKTDGHISISAVQLIKSDKIKSTLSFVCTVVSLFILVVFFFDSICFIGYSLMGKKIGFISDKIFAVVIPLGFAVIAFRFFVKLKNMREKITAAAVILSAFLAALPTVVKIIWGFEPPEFFYSSVNGVYDLIKVVNIPVILFLIAAGLAGMPIFLVIGGIAMTLLMAAGQEPELVIDPIFQALTETDLIAIPLFTLTGFFLSESRAGERLVRTFRIFFGWMPGGMIIAAVVICAFFSSFTGASGVTILALGGILYTILNQNKYTERFSLGMLTSVGGIGILFPPSLPVILVASSTIMMLHDMDKLYLYNYEIKHFFIGALIPGIILVLAMILTGFFLSRKVKFVPEKMDFKDAISSLKDSILEILLPAVLLIGYFTGFFNLVEVSAVSVIYVLIAEVFIKKDIPFKDIPRIFFKAVPIIGGILAILAMAKAISYAFIKTDIPDSFTFWMQGAINSKYVFLLLLNFVLLLLGCVMDIFSAILVLLPLVIPLGVAYGIDPLHLGIIFIINLEAGFLTPPVGINLFLASYRFNKPFMEICGYVIPFLLVRIVVVLLVTYLPWLSLWLVKLFGG